MNIIVTGFEPFGNRDRNASWDAVRDLQGVRTVLLPVSFSRAAAMVRELAAKEPDAVICVGEAGGRAAISLERVAINLMDARIPDNDGRMPKDEPVCPGRPAGWFATLPLRRMMARTRVPTELSCTAGTYVCNAVFYALMDEIDRRGSAVKGGFIHVPASGMETAQIRRALEEMIPAAAE